MVKNERHRDAIREICSDNGTEFKNAHFETFCRDLGLEHQFFTCIVNNMRANITVLPYDDHDRAIKLLHSLDRTVWSAKVEAIMESSNYETLLVDELFSKLKSSEVDRKLRANVEILTNSHSLALMTGSGSGSSANLSSRHFALSTLVSIPDEEFEVLSEKDLALLTRRF